MIPALRASKTRAIGTVTPIAASTATAARIQHPNVIAIYRVGELEGRPYLIAGKVVALAPGSCTRACSLVEGKTLARGDKDVLGFAGIAA